MLRDDLLKENIDGEALQWASERLLARPERRRTLMVISDGAPLDHATLEANPSDFLERHLQQVIARIETRSPIELLAIGIGHDVTDYYRHALMLDDEERLGTAMIEQLCSLFSGRDR
jgi:cobaltochelatase CobT